MLQQIEKKKGKQQQHFLDEEKKQKARQVKEAEVTVNKLPEDEQMRLMKQADAELRAMTKQASFRGYPGMTWDEYRRTPEGKKLLRQQIVKVYMRMAGGVAQ